MVRPACNQVLFFPLSWIGVRGQRVYDTSVALDGHDVLAVLELENFD